MALVNELYLAVMPIIHITPNQFLGYGFTEQSLTVFPDRNFATHFFPDEVDGYIAAFQNRVQHLIGGHSKGYEVFKEPTDDGRRVIVRVLQYVE